MIVGNLAFLACLVSRTMELSFLIFLELGVQNVIVLTLNFGMKRNLGNEMITMNRAR